MTRSIDTRTQHWTGLQRRSVECMASAAVLAACGAIGLMLPSQPVRAQPAGAVLPPGAVPVLGRVVTPNTTVVAPVAIGGGGNRLTIQQNERRAIIEWQKFNIGGASEVRFVQPDVGSVALNRVIDPSGDPSIIQGRLTANGQVILMNRNGVLFDRGSQVNVFALTAAAMNGPANTQGFYDRFLGTGLLLPRNSAQWSYEGVIPLAGGALPSIEVGTHGPADAADPRLTAASGGSIMLFAPRVLNQPGSLISAPDGQVILAAGSRIRLSENLDNAGEASISMRGLLVEVGADAGPLNVTSLVHNRGQVTAERGNVTLAALAVRNDGVIETTSAVTQNGSIWLRGRKETTLGAGSATRVPLDLASTSRLAEGDDFTPYRPQVLIEGQRIQIQGEVTAPGGTVTVTARPDLLDPSGPTRIQVESGARISVAGAWVDAPVSSNFISQRITSNELKDSPLQRGGILFGETVTLDLRRGPVFPLFDFTQQLNNQPRSVAEKATRGGSVVFDAFGDVVISRGSVTDVSGGGFRYSAAPIASTRIASNGVWYPIETAPRDLVYNQIDTAWTTEGGRWGISTPIGVPGAVVSEPATIEGRSAGSVTVLGGGGYASGVVVDGEIRGGVTVGPGQRASTSRPTGGTLIVGGILDAGAVNKDYRVQGARFERDPLPATVGFDDLLPQERIDTLRLSSGLFGSASTGAFGEYVRSGISTLQLFVNGAIDVPAGVSLAAPPAGSILFSAARTTIDGSLSAPGGSIVLNGNAQTSAFASRRSVTLGANAVLDVAGNWINDAQSVAETGVVAALPLTRDGGTVTIGPATASPVGELHDISLTPGSRILVGGGGSVSTGRRITAGNGGQVSINLNAATLDETLVFGAAIDGLSAGNGSRMSVTAPRVRIGGSPVAQGGELVLDPGFFDLGGFTAFTFNGLAGNLVVAGTDVTPTAQSLVFLPDAATRASGSARAGFADAILRPAGERRATSITLNASRTLGDGVEIGGGARIAVDPGASVALNSGASITIDGEILAPAGTITATLNRSAAQPRASIVLGSGARLLAPGFFQQTRTTNGLVQGSVLQGGQVSLLATAGSIQSAATALIDVSGASAMIDLDQTAAFASLVPGAVPVTVSRREQRDGSAGSILLRATDSSTLPVVVGRAGGPDAAGGNLDVESVARNDTTPNAIEPVHRIVVGADAPAAAGAETMRVDPQALAAGGIDRIRLSSLNLIEFNGSPLLEAARGITLDAPRFQSDTGTARVRSSGAVTFTSPSTLPPFSTVAGTGRLEVEAGRIDLAGVATYNGFGSLLFGSATDLRLIGQPEAGISGPSAYVGAVLTNADIAIEANQVYPVTRTDFTFGVRDVAVVLDPLTQVPVSSTFETRPGGRIDIRSRPGTPTTVLSAGGSIAFDADVVDSTGVVRAPLGTIAYGRVRGNGSLASTRVTLGEGSVSSTQLDTALVPFGGTANGRLDWVYNGTPVAGSPGREVAVRAQGVELAQGAQIDLSGGGELLAIEFQAGITGSTDVLRNSNVFAVLPNANLPFAPIDPHLAALRPLGFGTGRTVFDSVYLSGIDGLPAGNYTLLPGYYALLPGAFTVVAQTGTAYQNFQPGRTGTLPDGSRVISGYRTAYGSGARDAGWSAFAVRPGSAVSREAEYLTTNSSFFAQRAATLDQPAPRTPADAGRLELFAQSSLVVEGAIRAATGAANARSARVDIAARDIAVVDAVGQPGIATGFLQLDADPLSAFGASLLLGGIRTDTAAGTTLTTVADRIVVANSAASPLQGPEILLAARDSVTLESGSVVAGRGESSAVAAPLTIAGDGALVRAASLAPIAPPIRTGVTGATGTIDVRSGATLGADRSLLLDATRTTGFASVLDVRAGGSVSLGSSRVSLGETGAITDGLVLSAAQTAAFGTLADLTLRSYSTIDLYGSPVIGASTLGQLTLDSGGLKGFPAAGSTASGSPVLSAARVTLANSANATSTAGTAGTGTLAVDGGIMEIGAGVQAFSGYGSTVLRATERVSVSGTGTLTIDGDLRIESPLVAATRDAQQAWTVNGALVATNPSAVGAGVTTPGGQVQVSATTVDVANTWSAPGGRIGLEARTGAVELRSGASLDAGGRSLSIGGAPVEVPAGRVEVSSATGDLRLRDGARIDVSGSGATGRAGSVRLAAAAVGKSVVVEGTLLGSASGARAGSIEIDTGVLSSFSALNSKLDTGGFRESRELRVRSGDVTVAAADTVRARQVNISADDGALTVRGTVDASGPQGGSVVLSAEQLTVAAGGSVRAAGTSTASGPEDPYSPGGDITLTSAAATLTLEAGSTLDVSAGARGDAGRITLAAPRTGDNLGVDATLVGNVRAVAGNGGSAGELVVEGWRTYAATSLAPSAEMRDEFSVFMNGVVPSTVLGGLALDSGSGPALRTAVRGGVELRRAFGRDGSGAIIPGSGDLVLSSPWALTGADWIINGQPGSLAVRAEGSIVLQSALGLPDNNLPSTATWSIQLTGGADLTAADRDATASTAALAAAGTGDVRLATSAARLRTGTGRIDIDAGRDFTIEHLDAVVYTAGVPGAAETVATSRFPEGGGDISISAGRDARGTAGQWVNDWYRRGTAGAVGAADGSWWPSRPSGPTTPGAVATPRARSAFRGNVGTLGGGDIEVLAGRDILTLSAAAPTSGRVTNLGGVRTLDVQGGGDLKVEAGGRIDGGEYLVARGRGTISAGQSIGAGTPTGVLLLGESDDPANRGATVDLFAGGNVTLSAVSNPTILIQSSLVSGALQNTLPTGFQNRRSNFFTYAPESGVSVLSTTGDIRVSNTLVPRPSLAGLGGGLVATSPGDIYPPNVSLVAAQGDLVGGGPEQPLRLFPAADGNLQLLAGGDISRQYFTVIDQIVGSSWPTWRNTFLTIGENSISVSPLYSALFTPNQPRSITPRSALTRIHAGNNIVDSQFGLAGPTSVFAGNDLISTPLSMQNLGPNEASSVIAGRDIRFLPTRADGTAVQDGGYVRIGGPGTLRVQAGRNIDLGQSQGILAVGNNDNSSLPGSASVELTVMAGTTARPTVPEVTAFFVNLQAAGTIGSIGTAGAATPEYRAAVAILESAGITPDATAGDQAIAALFGPSTVGGGGSLSMFFSSIRTEGGSGINLVVPGGNINAGLPVAGGGSTGILTLAGGAIRSFLSGDFNVNQSKVVTLQGGDVLIYTSRGNIDAGRGALSSRTTAPPRRVERRDGSGNPIPGVFDFVPPLDATGAGIRTLTSDPDGTGPQLAPRAGDVFLFAPSGFISAGEAGITSGGSIFVLGTVVNPTLITAGGSSAGVPVAAPAFSTGSLGAASTTAGSQRASEDGARTGSTAAERSVVFKPSILLVDLVGFGSRFEVPENTPASQVKEIRPPEPERPDPKARPEGR